MNSRKRIEQEKDFLLEHSDSLNAEQRHKKSIFMRMWKSEQTHFDFTNWAFITITLASPMPLFYIETQVFEDTDDCTEKSWLTYAGTLAFLVLIAIFGLIRARMRSTAKKEVKFYYTESDSIMDLDNILKLAGVSLLGGAFSSTLGITSFWLYSGALERYGKTQPEATITSIGLIMFGSFLTGLEYYTKDLITVDYGLSFIVVCTISLIIALIMKGCFKGIMKRPSVLVFVVGFEILFVFIWAIIIVGLRMTNPKFQNFYLKLNTGCNL